MKRYIKAIIGTNKTIQTFINYWVNAKEIELPQGYSMVFLTNALLDDIAELLEISDQICYPELAYYTMEIDQILQQFSF